MGDPIEKAKPRLGKYEVLGTLGRGSMGVVYKARDPEIGRLVAVKTLRTFGHGSEHDHDAALERFRLEARSAGSLRHPNIITIFEISRDGDTPYLVMDYVEGESLESLIAGHERLSPMVVMYYLLQVAAGLDFAHGRGVIHRDIKPGNLHVDKHGRVFILDFGVAFFREELTDQSAAGSVIGTPGYMSPEQILSEPLDQRTDLFSLAAVAFECLTGKRPFAGETFTDVISNILAGNLQSLTSLAPDLPLALEAEFERALHKDRAERFSSATEMITEFCAALGVDAAVVRNSPSVANLPDMPRKKKSSGWHSLSPDPEPSPKPIRPPVREEPQDRVMANPWDFETQRVNFKADRSPRADGNRSTPGAMFTQFEGLQRMAAAKQAQSDKESKSLRRLTLVFAGVCIALGSGLMLMLFESGSDTSATAAPATEVRVGVSQVESKENPVVVDDGSVLVPPSFEAPPAGVEVPALSDKQLLGLMMDETASESNLLQALSEAAHRSLAGFVEASVVPLKNRSYLVRVEVVKMLAEKGDRRVVPELMLRLDDQDPIVRGHAARALGILGDRRALGYLMIRYQKEESPQSKAAMKRAIERIQGFPLKE